MNVSVGCDWITATAADHASYWKLRGLLLEEYGAQLRGGVHAKPGGRLGYYGEITPHWFIGRRDDGTMIEVHGTLAAGLFERIMPLVSNVSRLDVAATLEASPSPGAEIEAQYERAVNHKVRVGTPPAISAIKGRQGYETLYICSKASDQRGRVYDKGLESKEEEYAGCIRYEVQLRRRPALEAARHFERQGFMLWPIAQFIQTWYALRGVNIEKLGEATLQNPIAPAKPSKYEQTCAWLATGVSPAFAKLIAEIGPYQPLKSLLYAFGEDQVSRSAIWSAVELIVNEGERKGNKHASRVDIASRHLSLGRESLRNGRCKRLLDQRMGVSNHRSGRRAAS